MDPNETIINHESSSASCDLQAASVFTTINESFKSQVNDEVEDSLSESTLLLKNHIILLDPESDLLPVPSDSLDLYEDTGYSSDMNELDEEEAHKNIQKAKDRAVNFLDNVRKENSLYLNSVDEEINSVLVKKMDYEHSNSMKLSSNSSDNLQISHDTCLAHEKCNIEQSKSEPTCDADTTAEKLFQHFYNMHEKLPFDVKTDGNNEGELMSTTSKQPHIYDTEDMDSAVTLSPADNSLFYTLPYEIIQKILGYLTHFDLCHTVALVNRKWKSFAYDPIHWLTLNFDTNKCKSLTSYILACILQRAPLMKNLYLCGQYIDHTDMLYITKSCPLLQKLDLGFVTTVEANFLLVIALHCHHLEYLNLEGCPEVDPKSLSLLCQETRLPNLKGLNVSHCTRLTDDSLLQLIRHKLHLELLNIDGISWITDSTIKVITELRGSTLKSLYLDGCELTTSSVRSIVQNCTQLKVLSWSFGELLTDESLLLLKDISTLRELALKKGLDISVEAVQTMFQDGKLNNLQRLDLSECTHLKDEGVIALTNCCGASLTHLSLCWCWNITDVGLIHIVNKCRNLLELVLLGIDKIIGHCLSDVPTKMPKLKLLDLRQCNKIHDTIILDLLRKMPQMKAINYYGEEFEFESSQTIQTAPLSHKTAFD